MRNHKQIWPYAYDHNYGHRHYTNLDVSMDCFLKPLISTLYNQRRLMLRKYC